MIRNAKEGQQYKCVSSKSPAYTEGKVYTVQIEHGTWLIGDDGLWDRTSMLVSSFELVQPTENTE